MEAKDREGWPLRAGQRVRVAGVAIRPGGQTTRSWTGTVESVGECLMPTQGVRRVVVSVRADVTGALRSTLPERCCIRRQTREEREEMVARLRRQKARV